MRRGTERSDPGGIIKRVDVDGMIDLNCKAAVAMTQITLPFMKRGARVLQICSTAAFQPFPYLSVYAATKAFLYRYSRALRVELYGTGIRVTAVCPYWIKDTEFIGRAKKSSDSSYIHSFPLASRQKNVARHALLDAKLGLAVSTPGIVCTLHRAAAKIVPADLMMGAVGFDTENIKLLFTCRAFSELKCQYGYSGG